VLARLIEDVPVKHTTQAVSQFALRMHRAHPEWT
jgi:hypothetical protein